MEPFDCERIGDGLIAQPINASSSVAFLVAAVLLLRIGRRLEAAVMALTALGSIWFHAAPSGAGEWLHDVALYAAIAIAAIGVWQRLSESRPPLLSGGVFAVGVVMWFFSRTDGALCDPDALIQGHAVWHVLAAAAFVLLFTGIPDAESVT